MIELRELRQLMCINEFRHFGKAAAAVGMTQSALSKSLQKIEQNLGQKLFERSRAGVRPTALGEQVLGQARRVIGEANELNDLIKETVRAQPSPVTLGIGPAMSEGFVSEAIAEIVGRRKGLEIRILIDHWQRLTECLLAGELDLFVADAGTAQNDPRFVCTPLPPESFVWYCRHGHPLTQMLGKKQLSRDDLLSYPIASPKIPSWGIDWFAGSSRSREASRGPFPLPTIECESYALLKRIVMSTDCLSAALERTISTELNAGLLVELPIQAPLLTTHAAIVRLASSAPSPLENELVSAIQNKAQQER